MKVRITSTEIERAKLETEKAGLRLVGIEKRPDGTVRFEFGETAINDDWRADSPLYQGDFFVEAA
jgi:hypothetical protein